MLGYDFAHWSAFLTAAVLLNLAPGPDIAFVLGQTARGGKRSGTAAMFGIWAGAFCHVVFAAAGLSAVVAASATAFATVKWIGVAYLLWLGAQALRSKGAALVADTPSTVGFWLIVRQGVLVDLLNPKVAIFFLAFLPQFVTPGAGPVWLQLFVHGVLIIVVAAIVETPMVLLGDRITRRLRESSRLALWLDCAIGTMLIALGLRLAATTR